MSINELPVSDPKPLAKPWYSSKAWFVMAAGLIGLIATGVSGARSVSITVTTVTSLFWMFSAIALIGWGFLFVGYLHSRGYLHS